MKATTASKINDLEGSFRSTWFKMNELSENANHYGIAIMDTFKTEDRGAAQDEYDTVMGEMAHAREIMQRAEARFLRLLNNRVA